MCRWPASPLHWHLRAEVVEISCHDEEIIMQQRLTRVQWEGEVDKMARWGAKAGPADRTPIIDYLLLKLYGPRP